MRSRRLPSAAAAVLVACALLASGCGRGTTTVIQRTVVSTVTSTASSTSTTSPTTTTTTAVLRGCGTVPQTIGIVVSATPDVPCDQAQRVMRAVLGGSPECYSGPAHFHPCTVEGFLCTAAFQGERSQARCVNGGSEITGGT